MPILMVDVDGVLVHGRPEDGLPFSTFLDRDLGVSPDRLRRDFFEIHWADIVTGKQPMRPVLRRVLAEIAPHLDVENLIRYWFENDARLDTALVDDLQEQRRQGTTIYLATNQEHERAAYLMGPLGLNSFASDILYSARFGCRKPNPDFYRKAAECANATPEDIVFIDDMIENVDAAQRVGWQAFQWKAGMRLADVLPAI